MSQKKLIAKVSCYKIGQKEKELVWNLKDYKSLSFNSCHKNSLKQKALVFNNGEKNVGILIGKLF